MAVLDVVARVVLGEPAESIDVGAPVSDDEVIDELVGAAVASAQRLALASQLWLADEPQSGHLARLLADAVTRGVATSAAINVAGAMVGAAAAGTEDEVARLVTRARSVLADEDLIAGAAALMLALTSEIARSLALDPVTVEFELRATPL